MSRLLACIAASLLAISCAPFAAQRQPAASSPSPVLPGPLKLLPSGTFDATPERTSAHPPDAAIAAGRSELIVSLNSDISIRDKSGALIASSRPGKFYGYAPMPPTDERESIA